MLLVEVVAIDLGNFKESGRTALLNDTSTILDTSCGSGNKGHVLI